MMRFFVLIVFLVLPFCVIGCSTENPLCTDNYCITGEIFSKNDLEEEQTFEILPIDETALVTAIDAATVQDASDAVISPKKEKTTPEEWETLIRNQGNIPVLELVTVTNELHIQVKNKVPAFCISLNDELIDGVSYTTHRSTWIRITKTQTWNHFRESSTNQEITVIESSISEGEICGIKATEILAGSSFPDFPLLVEEEISHIHRLVMDMTVDDQRLLYISPTVFSKN